MTRPLTRIESVIQAVRTRIGTRVDGAGSRLPSVRAQAAAMGVSVSTVVEAYERLAAEGLISARAGSGFYVSGPAAPLALAEMEPRLDRAVDPLWVSRQSLETPAGHLKPGCGGCPVIGCITTACAAACVGWRVPMPCSWSTTPARSGCPHCASCCNGAARRWALMHRLSRSC